MIEFDALPHMKRSLVYLLVAVVSGLTFHLDMMGDTIDSLYNIYINTPSAEQLDAANAVFQQLHKAEFIDSLIQFNKSSRQSEVEARLHYWMTEYYYANGMFDDSNEAGERAIGLMSSVKDDHFKSDLLGIVANTQFRIGNYDNALKTQVAAYRIDQKLGEEDLISSDLNSFAAIYLAVKQPVPGIKCIEKAIAIERKLKRPERLAIRLGLASELYLLNKEYDNAMNAIEEAYQIDNELGKSDKAAIRLVQKGAVLEAMSKLDEAYSTELQAISILENTSNAYSLAVCYNQLGSICDKMGKPQDAIAYYKKALEYSIKCGSPNVECTAERGLWEVMRDNNPTIALLHLERYTALNDSLNNRLTAARLTVFDPYNTSIGNDAMEDNPQHSYLLRYASVILGIMLILMLAALFFAWRRNRSALAMSKQTQELRSHFFNNISRELHTPLTVIMNAGQQLLDSNKTSPSTNKRIGEMIINHGQNMLGLVNQLIDIEKVKTAAEQAETRIGNIVMFVRMLVDNFKDNAREHLINLQFSSPLQSVVFEFSPDYVRKIVHNLINNAFSYTPRNGRIDVKLDMIDANTLRLVVADTGKGIPVEERERIFEPFSQSENDDNGVKTGLDLSMVYYLVQAMNGCISVESELGQGTTFTISLPIQLDKNEDLKDLEKMSHFADKQLIPESNGNKQKPLVFIVENNEDVLLFIADHLRDDYNLRFARDGKEAFDNAQDLIPELIITNIIMPVMDGKELIRQIRQSKTLSHIPVIAMTTNTSEHERLSCIEAGADGVLVKPFNSREMELMVKHIIEQRIALRERFAATSNADNKAQDATTQMSKEDKEFLHRLVEVIQAQMANSDIDMEHIAAALSLSRKQLRTRVMAVTGLTPVAYVLQVRLNYARRMILNEDTSLTTIASRCGFQNLSHFSKAFKQQFGMSPLQFRKSVDNFGPP